MPANIAHLLICNKAVKVLQDGGGYEPFINILDADEHKPYFNLGSIGPDLSYYGSNWEGLKSLFFDQSDKPLGVDGWSYLLHSRQPNQFPLILIELAWKDTHWEQSECRSLLSLAAGHSERCQKGPANPRSAQIRFPRKKGIVPPQEEKNPGDQSSGCWQVFEKTGKIMSKQTNLSDWPFLRIGWDHPKSRKQ
jgi:hypothetical protein